MYLKQHPEIFMSSVKEPHFFSFDEESKMTKGPGDPIHTAITNFDEYQALFDNASNENAIGEASTSYLYRPEAPERIHAMLPDVKLIAILRNPADRAFSAYMHVVRDHREKAKDFEEALTFEENRKAANWEPIWHFTSVGHYYEQLKRYYDLFTPEQIRVYLYEDLNQNQSGLLADIYQFLGVDPSFSPGSVARYNASGQVKNKTMLKASKWLFSKPNPIRWISRKVIPESARLNFATWVRRSNLKRQSIPPKVKRQLQESYRDEIKQLDKLIGRDLSGWLE
jgi:hypothetical protein